MGVARETALASSTIFVCVNITAAFLCGLAGEAATGSYNVHSDARQKAHVNVEWSVLSSSCSQATWYHLLHLTHLTQLSLCPLHPTPSQIVAHEVGCWIAANNMEATNVRTQTASWLLKSEGVISFMRLSAFWKENKRIFINHDIYNPITFIILAFMFCFASSRSIF